MRNMVFQLEDVIDDPKEKDVWLIYQAEKGLENAISLQTSLWQISFDPCTDLKYYEVKHSIFYRILKSPNGKEQLAFFIKKSCEFLNNLDSIGTLHFQIRPEHIILFLDKDRVKIENIKYLNFGTMIMVDLAEHLLMP